jgi:cytochrome c553
MSSPEAAGGARVRRAGAVLALCVAVAACRQDMFNQPKVKPLAKSDFFEDGSGARPPVEGTVARGELRADRVFQTAIGPDGKFVATLPVPLTRALLLRGQERFNIFCSPCHGRVGDGRGMIVERGFKQPPSYHIDRLREQPIGYFFDVITNGFGQMSGYAAQVPPADRWAIAAYIRALQLSQHAPVQHVPARDRAEIERVRP